MRDTFTALAEFTLEALRPAAVPKLLRDERPILLFYPDKLSGLTEAPKTRRLIRFTAYAERLADHPEAALQAAGAQVKALLAAYTAATAVKNQGAKAVKDTISVLGADALWDVHCAALYVYRREPAKASAYFSAAKPQHPAHGQASCCGCSSGTGWVAFAPVQCPFREAGISLAPVQIGCRHPGISSAPNAGRFRYRQKAPPAWCQRGFSYLGPQAAAAA